MKTILKTLKWGLALGIALGSAGEIIRAAHAEDYCEPPFLVLNAETGKYVAIKSKNSSPWCDTAGKGIGNSIWEADGPDQAGNQGPTSSEDGAPR